MNIINSKIRIAVQKKGRLTEPSIEFLRSLGLNFDKSTDLISKCKKTNTELIFVRCSDIPSYVEKGIVDFGIVGENLIYEQNSKAKILKQLDFGKCDLVIAVPKYRQKNNLQGDRIATSYPGILQDYLSKNNIQATIIYLKGSVELAPYLQIADSICDITETGRTIKENGLVEKEKVFSSQAVVIGNSEELWQQLNKQS